MWSITLPTESNSVIVKHTASGVTLQQNMFGVRFDSIRPDVLVNVPSLMRVKKNYCIRGDSIFDKAEFLNLKLVIIKQIPYYSIYRPNMNSNVFQLHMLHF